MANLVMVVWGSGASRIEAIRQADAGEAAEWAVCAGRSYQEIRDREDKWCVAVGDDTTEDELDRDPATAGYALMVYDAVAGTYRIPSDAERVDRIIACQCGEWSGEPCQWSGHQSETVEVEWMPEHLRESHRAAGNSGVHPGNGSRRIRAERSCADLMVEHDGEWVTILG